MRGKKSKSCDLGNVRSGGRRVEVSIPGGLGPCFGEEKEIPRINKTAIGAIAFRERPIFVYLSQRRFRHPARHFICFISDLCIPLN